MNTNLRRTVILFLSLSILIGIELVFVPLANAQDSTAPTVVITTPIANSSVSAFISIASDAFDNIGVTKVEFYLDNILWDIDYVLPHSFLFNLTLIKDGTHVLVAKAYDAAGNVGTSTSIPVSVNNILTAPNNLLVNATTKSTASISWAASIEGNWKASGYKIFRNSVQIATTKTFSFVDQNLSPATTYKYSVMGYDDGGNTSPISTTISVTTKASGFFGMAVGEAMLGLDNATLNAKLDQLSSLGVTWLRFDIAWNHVQPNNNGKYDWSFIDPFVSAATAHKMNLLATLGYTPSWAASAACNATGKKCPPADPSVFATFVNAAVLHYASQGITHWEIWNEPNQAGQWGGAASASGYTVILKSAYNAIKRQSPTAIVVTGGMAPATSTNGNIAPISFLSQIYANGGKPYFDAVGMHPYSFPAMPSYYATWNAWSQMASTTPSLRSIMIANGDSAKQIWLTEYGAPTGGPGKIETSTTDTHFSGNPDHVTEAVQASMLSAAFFSAQKLPWASTMFWYAYDDIGTSQTTNENFFGLFRYDGSTKPAYITLENLL